MNRHVLTADLRDDPAAIDAYKKHHRQVWPEVLDSLKRAGIEDMQIFVLERRLVMIVETRTGLELHRAFATHHETPGRVAEWEALMLSLLRPPPGSKPGEWWTQMQPVFHLQNASCST